jgi:archaellum component FlaG (FlaF/FlaG flagellin family)
MACTPFSAPNVGLFENVSQGVWSNANETKGNRTCTYSGGNLTVAGPNGSLAFFAVANQTIRHKFFGTGNFLAVLFAENGPGPVNRSMSIVDFTAAAITSRQVLFIGASSTNPLPWLQNSGGVGSACLIGAPTPSGVAGLAILRSDTGAVICAGPPPLNPSVQIIGEATTSAVQIKDGGTIIGGPCPFPSGQLKVVEGPQTFTTVKVGGCVPPSSTKTFTLKNTGNDCLAITAIADSGPFSVSNPSIPFGTQISPGGSMTVTVTFAPGSVGNFPNVNLAVTRSPARGDDKLVCSGQAVLAQAAFSVLPSTDDFGTVQVGAPATGGFTIKNTGDVPISFSLPPATPGSPFQWSGFSGTISCNLQQAIEVKFTPQVEGLATATATVTESTGGMEPVTLQGTGCIPNAAIVVPPAPFPQFGDVRQGYRMPRFVTVNNTGDDSLSFTATISGPDAALFGLMKPSQSITDVVAMRTYSVLPQSRCGPGPTGDGTEEVVVVFFANAAPPRIAAATLTIDSHNDPTAPPSFSFPLSANVIAGNVVDAVAVFDTSGSMSDLVQGGGTKMAAAIQAGRLLASLIPADLGNRIAATRFSTDATTFLPIGEVTSGNQQTMIDAITNPPLAPNGSTAIAAGLMTGIPEFAVPRTGTAPANLTKAVVVLTDGMDNTAFKNPADNQYYSLSTQARDPANLGATIPTNRFTPPAGVKVYAVGLGTGLDVDASQLAYVSSGAGGYWNAVDPTQPAVTYRLQKYYTQIYMDLFDAATIKDPTNTIAVGQQQVIEFDVLQGDVSAMLVMFDLNGIRLPFWLESPAGEIIDASFVPAGFQLRSGSTDTSRFLDFVLPWGNPKRYAGRWRLVVRHDGRACRGRPNAQAKDLGFVPGDCKRTRKPIDYGFAIGVGSNFRLQAYVSPGVVNVGDPIRLTGAPTEAGLPVTGCSVTVDAVSPSGQTWPGIVLADDGAHDDGDADDGEYARRFTQTAEVGTYTFTFRATGFNRDGEPVHREAVRSKYVTSTVPEPPCHDGSDHHPCSDECCAKVVKLLELGTRLLEAILAANTPR